MKNRERKRNRYILPIVLLALVCIGAVELCVCAYRAPDVFQRVIAPVRAVAQRVEKLGDWAWDNLNRRFDTAMAEGAAQIQLSLQRLDEYLSRPPAPEPEPEESPEEVQLVDGGAVTPPPRSRAAFSITALALRRGTQYLTGGTHDVVYYDQTSASWSQEPYGSDTIGRYGCGPAAMAMVVSTLTDSSTDPAQMALHCVEQGYWARKHGSYWSIVPGVAEDFGLICTSLPPEEMDLDTITHYLSTGQLLVALMGPGHFTNGGHFIVLRGVTLDGSVLVADPASSDRSLTTWDLDLILEELSAGRSNGGPLWAISSDLFS